LLETEILEMNSNSPSFDNKSLPVFFTRAQTLSQLDCGSDNDDFTDEISDFDEQDIANLTENDAEEQEFEEEEEEEKTFML
jgi:hypothetical protein